MASLNTSVKGRLEICSCAAGNRAIAEHSGQGKGLLLFRKTPDGLRFEGEMVCEGYHREAAPDRTCATREAIVFELRLLEAVAEKVEQQPIAPDIPPSQVLRQLAFSAASESPKSNSQGKRNIYQGAETFASTYWHERTENAKDATLPPRFIVQTVPRT